MAIYRIQWKPSAVKDLDRLDRGMIPHVVAAVDALASNPFPSDVRKIQGSEHTYRIRLGDLRVIYRVFKGELVIEVVRVRHRREVYRR